MHAPQMLVITVTSSVVSAFHKVKLLLGWGPLWLRILVFPGVPREDRVHFHLVVCHKHLEPNGNQRRTTVRCSTNLHPAKEEFE
jgi:hypothetical protein